jgi:alkanesulfonate monooxygenase SsuD/methylene tetrahydromethanopterin reductase-like flavin-dependent oxidoreductase (luciferase family)
MLSRNQPRAQGPGRLSLDEIQNPLIDAYLEALPPGREPRILASRTVFVADDRKEALRFCEAGRNEVHAGGKHRMGSDHVFVLLLEIVV